MIQADYIQSASLRQIALIRLPEIASFDSKPADEPLYQSM
jgi:hypothetical protein